MFHKSSFRARLVLELTSLSMLVPGLSTCKLFNFSKVWFTHFFNGDTVRFLKNGGDLQRTPSQHAKEILALFAIAKLWNQHIYPTAEQQIRKMKYIIYIHNGIFFSHKEEQSYVIFRKRLEWEIIKLNQSPEDNCYMFSLIYGS